MRIFLYHESKESSLHHNSVPSLAAIIIIIIIFIIAIIAIIIVIVIIGRYLCNSL
jgi:TRAP-type C4-dicarboxylate transport system permease small subunit